MMCWHFWGVNELLGVESRKPLEIHVLDIQSKNTVVSYEYPEAFVLGKNERYYPIINEENKRLYEKYLEEAKNNKKVTFLGRLGDYKYYDMDQAVARALELARTFN